MKENFFISKTIPGFILNLDKVTYISYSESIGILWICFSNNSDGKFVSREYKGDEAAKLYNELKTCLGK